MNGSRLVLVVASQCEPLGDLSFLPDSSWKPGDKLTDDRSLPVRLYEQFIDSEAGACRPVDFAEMEQIPSEAGSEHLVPGPGSFIHAPGSSLLINPSVRAAEAALTALFDQAFATNAPGIVLYFVGHGAENLDGLLLKNSPEYPTGVGGDCWQPHHVVPNLRGDKPVPFLMMVDACFASNAETRIAQWDNTQGRAAYAWIASSHQQPAYNGDFTRHAAELLTTGATRDQLGGDDLVQFKPARFAEYLETKPDIQQVKVKTNNAPDPALFVAINRKRTSQDAALGFNQQTRLRYLASIDGYYEPVDLPSIEEAFKDHSFAVLTGGAGTGKTRISSALRSPPVDGPYPTVFGFDAVAYLDNASTIETVATDLHPQLLTNDPYRLAHDRHRSETRDSYDLSQSQSQRYLTGPLNHLKDQGVLRVVVDGLDQIDTNHAESTITSLEHLAHTLDRTLRILVTSRPRPEGPIPNNCHEIPVPPISIDAARNFLQQRQISKPRIGELLDTTNIADINWLLLTLASELPHHGPDNNFAAAYNAIIAETAKNGQDPDVINKTTAILVAAGQVAGVGPKLPYSIFQQAIANLDGPSTPGELYPLLADPSLYRIIERAFPATPDEHIGLFHQTAIDRLRDTQTDETNKTAHNAIADAITNLTEQTDSDQR